MSEDDKCSWVIGTIAKTILQRMESSQRMLKMLGLLMHPGLVGAAELL
jgi:hypothetical protein